MIVFSSSIGGPRDLPLPVTIEGDCGKAFRLLLLGLLMTGASAFTIGTGGPVSIGVCGFAFFGLASLVSLAQVVWPPTLSVTADGIALRSLRSWHMSWSEVAGVRLSRAGRSSFVFIDYRADARPPMLFGRRRQGRVLPGTLDVPAEELRVQLLDALRSARTGTPEMGEPIGGSASEPVEPARWTVPWVSVALAIGLSLVFAAEIRFPVSPATGDLTPSNMTLAGFGASSRALTLGQGEWFRAVLAPVLHANLDHLLGNVAALLWAGWLLERLAGRAWFGAIYAAGALAGELASMAFNPTAVIGVGASGAITALFAATYAVSFHFRGSSHQARLQSRAIGILAPALFTAGRSAGSLHIDVAAHAGGAVAGAAIGLLLLRGWPRQSRHPAHRRLALSLAALGGAAVLVAIAPAATDYGAWAALAAGQQALRAKDLDRASEEAERVLARRPRDADGWMLEGQIALARADARAALADFAAAYGSQPTPAVLSLRGVAAFYAGEAGTALSDLQRAAASGGGLYPAIWLDMFRERAGLGPSLAQADLAGADRGWPRPVAEMFAGALTPAQLFADAARSPRTPTSDDLCEADFYVAEWGLIHRPREDTRSGFAKALAECPPGFDEALMARLELARPDAAPRGAVTPPRPAPASP